MTRPLILVSCRVDVHGDIGEVRDALDQRLSRLLCDIGAAPILIPNQPSLDFGAIDRLRPDGLLLSGGNDLCTLGGDRSERDETEARLLDDALQRAIPVFGICRGAQLLCERFGGELERVDGHVKTRHALLDETGRPMREVNSYHQFAIRREPAKWEVLGRTVEGHVEWVRAKDRRVQGVMWHPERERVPTSADTEMLRVHFGIA